MLAGDAALDDAAGQPVLAEAAGGFASTVESRDCLTCQVHHLAARVDPESGARIVIWLAVARASTRTFLFVPRRGFAEIGIVARVHE